MSFTSAYLPVVSSGRNAEYLSPRSVASGYALLGIILSTLLAGCGNTGNELGTTHIDGVYTHHINPEQASTLGSDRLTDVTVIPLEANDRSLIAHISKLEKDTTTGNWYILDHENPYKILVFSEDGDFVKNIRHLGAGPYNYQRIDDFHLSDGNWIEVFEADRQRLIRYDLETDEPLSEKKIPFYAYKYAYLENGTYVFYKNKRANNFESEDFFYKLLVLDSDFRVVEKALSFTIEIGTNISIMTPSVLTRTSSGVFFNGFHADTIYRATHDTIQAAHILDLGSYTLTIPSDIEFTSSQKKVEYFFSRTSEHVIGANQFKQTDQFISFNFLYQKRPYFYYYDRPSERTYLFDRIEFVGSDVFFPPPVTYEDSTLISIYTIPMLNQRVPGHALDENSPRARGLKQGKENQNPVLVTYKLDFNVGDVP